MKWGRKKPPPSSSPSLSQSQPSFLSHVFPISWLSKFKHMNINSKPKPGKVKRKGKLNSPFMGSPQCGGENGGRFYGGDDDDDAFWRLSFGEENVNGNQNGGVLKSVWYESDDELDVPSSRCKGSRSNCTKMGAREEAKKINEMVSGLREARGLNKGEEISLEFDAHNGDRSPWRRIEKEGKLSRMNPQVMDEKVLELERGTNEVEWKSAKSVDKESLEWESPQTIWTPKRDKCKIVASGSRKHCSASSLSSKKSSLRNIAKDGVFATKNLEETAGLSAENLCSEWQKLKAMKIEELKSKSEKERKSLHVSRDSQRRRTKQNSKVRVYSPRTASKVEICKIKALEDMKKSKLKMKKKEKERIAEETTCLESFAVAKCSFDPQQDFRDSMLEMIMEKRISQPEELEELLACYLTLNSDEYHDLIIKVFRQVWFDLNQACFSSELHSEDCFYN
jgi:uncharacterized protein (TIGR01568 family)